MDHELRGREAPHTVAAMMTSLGTGIATGYLIFVALGLIIAIGVLWSTRAGRRDKAGAGSRKDVARSMPPALADVSGVPRRGRLHRPCPARARSGEEGVPSDMSQTETVAPCPA